MDENETIKSLEKLKSEVELELDVVREKLWEKERSIIGLINGRIQKLASEVDKRLVTTFKEVS